MPVVNPQKLVSLQKNADDVRNICVLAHVDHGKTSLTDSLIATNGIISSRMAGKIRYLDSRPDEQIRGITMESSAISLLFSLLRRPQADESPEQKDYLINLIDSPGHIDFSSEVSTASRLCDGAVILVDAVEGVCSQTVAVLRQTWIEHLKPILVINKMDRLITELRMTPSEAYSHLARLIEQVNAVIGSFFQGERMEDDLKWRERLETRLNSEPRTSKNTTDDSEDLQTQMKPVDSGTDGSGTMPSTYQEKEDEDIYFEPEKGNVIFSSAIDGWAFTVKQFASFYEKKLSIKRDVLEKVLWGDFYLDPKTKRILGSKHLKGRPLKPMFVQLVLENIWAIYDATVGGNKGKGDASMIEKITKGLSINLPAHIIRSRDPHAVLVAIFAAWIPLSTALLVSVIEHLPSPVTAQAGRMPGILEASPGFSSIDGNIKDSMIQMRTSTDAPLVAFISKMISVPEKDLPENKSRTGATLTAEEARELGRRKRAEIARAQAAANGEEPDVAELRESLSGAAIGSNPEVRAERQSEEVTARAEPERLIGFARLFSGTLQVGDEVFVLGPKFSPDNPHARPEPQKATVTALYLMMGRGLEPLTSVPAGVVFGVAGLEGIVMKSGTLCSELEGGVNLAGLSMGSQPIVRVALEPENPADLGKMVTGLRLLSQSDPSASYEIMENGEHVILTAGELHLERCLKDLRERFARCEIQAGAPIVPYRESIVNAAEMNPPRDQDLARGTVLATVSSKLVSIRLRVMPLPYEVTEFLLKNAETIRDCYAEQPLDQTDEGDISKDESRLAEPRDHKVLEGLEKLKRGLHVTAFQVESDIDIWRGVADKVVAFGPRRNGPNLLIDLTSTNACQNLSLETLTNHGITVNGDSQERIKDAVTAQDFSDKISYAFQLATAHGPLCQEPMQGVAVFLEQVNIAQPDSAEDSLRDQPGRLTGEVIKTVRESIGKGFLDWSPRMMLAMYSCEIQASTEVLGRVYGVITRRRGRILSESMKEGTPFFSIVSVLPVAESFGFSEEIRKRTSGAASPQLIFQGFEMLDEDPFWVPFTEEELEDLGELADKENVAKKYMDTVRRRKGLFVKEKKVEAEKQKTLKR